ncbi:unnamed protein product [Nyctereutes procyonoides]|uniref:(raccoon dog) hypothetical protein n=1 Tax=Nyctereutes procyonoides TaxID=34880 RepID=A0A811YBR7_NYCPR|nr:unnamed protein product [Nyctereutes procyonoides]
MPCPSGDLGIPVEAGTEGGEDSFREINFYLDCLKEKNDHLHACLQEGSQALSSSSNFREAPSNASCLSNKSDQGVFFFKILFI